MDIFVSPPKEAEVPLDKVWKLNIVIYGLIDAFRTWYFNVREVLSKNGIFVRMIYQFLFMIVMENCKSYMCPSWWFLFGVRESFTKNIFAHSMVFRYIGLNLQENERVIYTLTKPNMLSPRKLQQFPMKENFIKAKHILIMNWKSLELRSVKLVCWSN